MKKNISLHFMIMILSAGLCGCGMVPDGPQTVKIAGRTYTTGFYGSMYPYDFDYSEELYEIDKIRFRGIANTDFDLLHVSVGAYTEGTIFCNEEQLEEAEAYYSDPDNFTYYCRIGKQYVDQDPLLIDISDVDTDIFNALIKFAEDNSYDPFRRGSGAEKIETSIPDEEVSPTLVFYKETKDGMFTSSRGEKFHIVDGELLLVYYYDHGYGEYEKMVAVRVPDEISSYVIRFLSEHEY